MIPCRYENLLHCRWTREPSLSLHDRTIPSDTSCCEAAQGLLFRHPSRPGVSPTQQTAQLQDVRFGSTNLLSPWFPQMNPEHPKARTWRRWHSRRRIMLVTASLISVSVFLTNLIFAIILSTKYKHSDAVVILHEGDCGQIKRLNTIFHVAINILGSLLLGASNLCMQLLAAPTRAEVDRAHLKGKWLDIGVPSWRNLSHISNKRKAVWWCLGISSVPLQVM